MVGATELATKVRPERTALLCMEMQRGVVGDLSTHPVAGAVRGSGVVERIASLEAGARAAGIRVVHCTAQFRADRAGSYFNMASINRALGDPDYLLEGTPAVEVMPELWAEADLTCPRYHGISPFAGTPLDALLRSLGVRTVIAVGVSLNLGIIGMSIEAVNNGYEVVVPSDCAVGIPTDYGEQVIKYSLRVIATITTGDALLAAWSGR